MKKDLLDPGEMPFTADPDVPLPPEAPQGRVFCGDLNMRIDRDGNWYYHGSPIGRKELVCLFSSVLTRDRKGAYWLVTPAEMGRIQVDDAPFVAVEMFGAGSGMDQVLSFRTNIDQIVSVDEDHPIRVATNPGSGEPTPYVTVRRRMEARIARSVYYELVALGVEESIDHERVYGVWSNGTFFELGRLEEAR